MNKFFLTPILVLLCSSVMLAQTIINGVVSDTNGPLPGANIKVSRKALGTVTNFDGNFTFKVTDIPPFTIEISSLGYKTKKVQITKNNQTITVLLKENATALDEVVISASRTPERVMESPITIERLDSRAIKNTSSASFYEGLENLKGVDINAGGLTFKTVNTRGFATFGNERFIQLVDGMDNSSPALNFAVGNLLGMSELDVKNVEILPGAASALYGANAFNGIMLMTSKNPFDDQGISYMFKTGFTKQKAAGNNPFYDTTIRMAYAFNQKFAAKATFSYLQGEEWHATDYRNTTGLGGIYKPGIRENGNSKSDPNYDGANVYGDVVSTNLPAIGRVSRTGYKEIDLMDYEAKSIKFGASLHYRPWGNDRLEIIWNTKYGTGNTIYQGLNRFNLKNFFMEQHKLEFKGKNFFVRGYFTGEDAGDSYNTEFAAINMNNKWKSNTDWFMQYAGAYFMWGSDVMARKIANAGMPKPGTPAFTNLFNEITSDPNLRTGAKLKDNTRYYHVEGNLNLRDYIDWAEVQVGGSYRRFHLKSYGTIYTDGDSPIEYDEYGIYSQLQKKFLDDRLKFTGSVRFDKVKNFDGNFSPRVSLAYAMGETKNHNFRVSFQTGFRNPTTQDQYIGLDGGIAGYILGTAPDNLTRFSKKITNTLGNTYTITGTDVFERGFSKNSITQGAPTKVKTELVKPEKVIAYEVGYRSALPIGKNKLSIDMSAYYNQYDNFISNKDVIILLDPANESLTGQDLVKALSDTNTAASFSTKTNSHTEVNSYGVGIGLSTKVFNGFDVGLNYTWSKFNFDQSKDPDFRAGFNTPEHKVKFQFGHPNVFKNFGFNINARWQNEFFWESTFLRGTVDARTVIDAQMNYKVPSIKSVFKIGGTNLTGKEYLSAPGVGAIGSQFYVSWTINN